MDEVLPGLFLGSISDARDLSALHSAQITHILIAAKECIPYFPSEFSYMKVSIADNSSADLSRLLSTTSDFIESALASQGRVLVHCFAGMSRSASIVIAYMIRRDRLKCAAALAFVQSKRPVVCPNSSFLLQLQTWERDCEASPALPAERDTVKCRECHTDLCEGSRTRADGVPAESASFSLESLSNCPFIASRFGQLFCSFCGNHVGDYSGSSTFRLFLSSVEREKELN